MKLYKVFNVNTLIFMLLSMAIFACTKPNEEPAPNKNDHIGGRRVRYTVLVADASGAAGSNMGIDSAKVSLVMNDSIYNEMTNENGIAKFNNLASGILAVQITHPDYTSINMTVDITAQNNAEEYDSNNLRNASTIVPLFPTKGDNMATISGKALAELNTTVAGLENAPKDLQISAYIEQTQLINYINHTGDGKIIGVVCQSKIKKTKTDGNSYFSIKVPASEKGLKVILTADDFAYNQVMGSGSIRHVYKAAYDTVMVYSGMKRINDIKYE